MGRRAPLLVAALLAVTVGPVAGQADSVAREVEWEKAEAGETVRVPPGRTFFFVDRPELNRLRVRQRDDSVRIAALEDIADTLRAAVDSAESALVGCRRAKAGLASKAAWKDTVLAAERAARHALQDLQPSGLERLLDGPSGFLVGTGVGLTGGVLACRGAN